MIRDDEMVNANVGVFYDAPGYKDPDFFAFTLLKYMFGSYEVNRTAHNINDMQKQYNSHHAMLGIFPDVTIGNSHYFPYSDTGIWGNYFFGNEVFVR